MYVCMYVCMHVCVYIYIDLGSGAGDLTRVLCGLVACASWDWGAASKQFGSHELRGGRRASHRKHPRQANHLFRGACVRKHHEHSLIRGCNRACKTKHPEHDWIAGGKHASRQASQHAIGSIHWKAGPNIGKQVKAS